MRRSAGIAALLLCIFAAAASAQDQTAATQDPQQETDVRDVWRHVRHREAAENDAAAPAAAKPFLVMAPSISSKPSTGPMVGLGATLAFVDGDPSTTHLSSAGASVKASFREQATGSVRFGIFTPGDRWFLQGDNRFQWTSLNTYAVGGNSTRSTGANLRYDWYRVYETAYRQVAPRLFVGGGLNVSDHTHVRDEDAALGGTAYAAYTAQHGLMTGRQVSAGTNVGISFDTRDNSINAARGWLASGTYRTFFSRFLGGTSSWQELNLDVRTYGSLTHNGRQKLAFWFLGDVVTGGAAPYFDLPGTGGDFAGRSSRGYSEGRYRGPHLLYGEVEYRAAVVPSGLFGVVAFLNTATIDGAPGQKLFDTFAPAAGTGLRVLLDKHSRTNLAIDYGWGRDGSRGLYLGMQEAF